MSTYIKRIFRVSEPKAVCGGVLVIAAVLVLWQASTTFHILDVDFVSSPTQVASALLQIGKDGQFYIALGTTMLAVLEAFIIGWVAGLVIGLALGLNAMIREAFYPIVRILIGVPKSLLLPILVLFVGLGSGTGIIFGAILTTLFVAVNVVAGIDLIDKRLLVVSTAFGAGFWQRLYHVIIPGSLPGIFAAVWHGMRSAFSGVLLAELFVSAVGVGYLVKVYTNNYETGKMFAVLFVMAWILIMFGSIWQKVDNYSNRWRSNV